MISKEKQLLRARILETIRSMTDAERAQKSAAIAAHLARVQGVVFGFAPMRLEPDWTTAIGQDLDVALPRVEGTQLIFHRISATDGGGAPSLPTNGRAGRPLPADLVRGSLGVFEPTNDSALIVEVGAADFILVPGVAFDRAGARLGRGGGFYDRLLGEAALTARRVAVCFACQLVDRVPVEAHDALVDAIVTENGWIDVRSSEPGRD